MTSLVEKLPREIARLEAKYGSDNQFVKDLKRQYEGMLASRGKTAEEVYTMQAVKFPVQEEKKEAPSSSRVPLTMEEQEKNLEDWLNKGIYEAAAHQMSMDSPSEKTGESPSSTSADEKDSQN
jgi:hypothetical protein